MAENSYRFGRFSIHKQDGKNGKGKTRQTRMVGSLGSGINGIGSLYLNFPFPILKSTLLNFYIPLLEISF